MNEALAAMNGMPVAQHIGRTVGAVHPQLAHTLESIYRRVLETGESSEERELAVTSGPGEGRILVANHHPIRDRRGQVVAVRTVVADVTDHARLRAVESELRRALRARDAFLSITSQELRTPLQALQLVLDGLIRNRARQAMPGPIARRLDLMRSQVQRLRQLIDNLLSISRMASGRLSLDPDQVDLGLVVREVMDRFAPNASRAGVSFHLEVDADVSGQWDGLRLEEIVANLLSNAIKFGRGGSVDIAVEDRGEQVRLVIRDHGIGIAPEDRERVFEQFERPASERNHGGIGMGLWIVRQLVVAHGGAIDIDGAPGRGTVFTVSLPRRGPPSTSPSVQSPLPAPSPLA